MFYRFGRFFLTVIFVLTLDMEFLFSQPEKQPNFRAEEPVLITSAGQSADVLMVKLLAQKAGLKFVFEKMADPAMVDSVKSVILVCGGSSKGLGAARIDKEQEFKRIREILQRAKEKKIPVIGIHVGGKSRRGKLSDYFNQPVAEKADYLIVVKEGNQDGFFSKIATENKIPIQLPEKIIAIQNILKEIYGK